MEKEAHQAVVAKTYGPFDETYGTEIICLKIGPRHKAFRVHEKRLRTRIPSFLESVAEPKRERSIVETVNASGGDGEVVVELKGDLKVHTPRSSKGESEATTVMDLDSDLTIVLPNDNPVYWDMLLLWVYHDKLPLLKRAYSSEVGWNWDPCAFYVLADNLDIPQLKDKIISTLQEGQAKSRLWQYIERLDWTWRHTRPGCGMRRYLVLALVRNIVVYKDPKEPNPDGRFTVPTKKIVAVLNKYPDLLEAVVESMRGQNGIEAKDPRIVDPCVFHEHWPRRDCTYSHDADASQIKDEFQVEDRVKKHEESNKEADLNRQQGAIARKKVVRFGNIPDGLAEAS